jgi:hypothetical protein
MSKRTSIFLLRYAAAVVGILLSTAVAPGPKDL